MKLSLSIAIAMFSCLLLCRCSDKQSSATNDTNNVAEEKNYGGYSNQIDYGRHLVDIIGCNDCHTPKKMTPQGPVPDTTLLLSGHPASVPPPGIDPKEIESKGLAATNDMTAWIGPWGISYAANLTPDETGIGNWSEAQFIRALREGKSKGLENGRPLLPPMPWQDFSLMKDEELKAIFAYLKTVKPIDNVVPAPVAPVAAPGH